MLAVVLALLAAGFTYAHQRIYQRSYERDLMDQATRSLRTRPELHRVSIRFEGLDAYLEGAVNEPSHKILAQDLIDRLPGVRALGSHNQIRVNATLKLSQLTNGVWQASGWLPSPAWQERALLLLTPGAPRGIDAANLKTDRSVSEPSFLNHPKLPSFGQRYLASVGGGALEMEVARVRLTGRVRTDADKTQLLEAAGHIWGGLGGTTLEEHLETLALRSGTNAATARDFSWAGFDLGRVLRSFPIFFESGGTSVRSVELGKVSRLSAAILQLAPKSRFRVTGFTDAAGNPAANQKLSLKRAEAVAALLVQQGIPRSQLDLHTQSERLAGGNSTSAEARKHSRRVELSLK